MKKLSKINFIKYFNRTNPFCKVLLQELLISIITFLFFGTTTQVFAQDRDLTHKTHSLYLQFGRYELKEENLHGKVHKGLLYGLTYEHSKQSKNLSQYNIGLVFSRLKTTYEELPTSANVQLFGNYNYLFEMINNAKFSYHFGPEFRAHYDLSFYPNWDESHLYWADYVSIGVGNQFHYRINEKQSLRINAGLPFVSIISRPELNKQYKIDDISFGGILNSMNSNIEGGTLNRSFYFRSKIEYHFQISDRIGEAICYSYNYNRVKSSNGHPFQSNQHNLGLKIYF